MCGGRRQARTGSRAAALCGGEGSGECALGGHGLSQRPRPWGPTAHPIRLGGWNMAAWPTLTSELSQNGEPERAPVRRGKKGGVNANVLASRYRGWQFGCYVTGGCRATAHLGCGAALGPQGLVQEPLSLWGPLPGSAASPPPCPVHPVLDSSPWRQGAFLTPVSLEHSLLRLFAIFSWSNITNVNQN